MNRIYDYENNITITNTANGDKVITMNKEILTLIINSIYDASELQAKENHFSTSNDTKKLWKALIEKEEEK